MDRGATAGVVTEIGSAKNTPVHLFEAHFDTTVVRASDAYRNIEWPAGSGNLFLANGHFLNLSSIDESADLQVHEVSVQLTGVEQSWVSLVLQENYIDRRLVIYKAFLDANGAPLVSPFAIFDGRMNAPVIEENPDDGTCVVTVTASSHFADFERTAGRRTNHEDQQIYFPGDLGFEYVSEINRDITWGAA